MTSLRHLRSSTADKRPDPTAMVDGQLAMNYDLASPGLFFKNDNGTLVKVGPVHVGTTAPNVSPAAGGTAGNSVGEQWLDTTGGVYVLKVWDGSAWRSESGTFVDVSGDTMTGALVMDNQQQVRFRETTANGTNYIALQAPASVASDKTITLPDVTGTVVTTGDTGTVTSTMILDGTILNADVNASAAIAGTKISPDFGSQNVVTTGTATAASLNPTGSSVPTNGVYLPAANSVAISTNGTGRLFVDSAGNVGVGTGSPGAPLDVVGSADTFVLSSNATNSTTKEAKIQCRHYTNAEENVMLLYGFSTSTNNAVALGGGSGNQNAATFVSFYTAADTTTTSGSERARIDSSGRLLVGTSTSAATALLQVQGNSAAATNPGTLYLFPNYAPASLGTGDILGRLQAGANDGSVGATIDFVGDATWGSNDYPSRLVFSTTADGASSPTERMRITNGGQTLINDTTDAAGAGARLHITSNASQTACSVRAGTNGTPAWYFANASGSKVGDIVINSGGTAYNTTSDYRLKENFVPLTNAADRLSHLNVHRFNFIADPDKTVDGFIAHEAQQVVPEAVTGEKDAVDDEGNPVYQGIDQSKLVPLLTAALQEALAEIESLKARVTALEP